MAADTQLYCYVDGLVQDYSNSIANAVELLQSCTKPSMWWLDGFSVRRIFEGVHWWKKKINSFAA